MTLFRPSSNDVRQVDNLTKLGVNPSDIASILGISEPTLNKWKEKSPSIDQALKPKARPEYNMNHPDYIHMVEEAFTCGGRRFYRFKDEYTMSTGRYKYYYATLKEMELRMSFEKQQEFIDAFRAVLNGGKKKQIDFESLWKLLFNMESRTKLAFEPQMIKNLAAVAYFDDTEDLTTFDRHYGAEKIKLWESHNLYDFFLTKPIGELFNLKNISIESLQEYLQTAEEMIVDLNSGLQKVLEENS